MNRRIALISEHASPLASLGGTDFGGQNVYVAQIAQNLAALGYAVDIFTRRGSDDLPRSVRCPSGIRVIHVPAGPPRYVPKEDLLPYMEEFTDFVLHWRRCRGARYDLYHANFWMSGLVAADLKRATGTPFIVTFHALGRVRRVHQGQADGFPDARAEIEDRIIREADCVIAECPQDEEDLLCLYGADPERMRIVPCGVDNTRFSPVPKGTARTILGLDPDERIVLQLGRLVPRKGIDNVIRGFARLITVHGVEARLLVVGGESDEPDPVRTPEIGRLRDVARAAGVGDRVVFVGRRGRDVLRHYYSAADVFVTTPWYEPFGITPLEAMACGTPVIGANVGGIKFTVRDGETGYLVPPRDPDAVGERLAHLYRYPQLMRALAARAIQRANDCFSWSNVAQAIARLYEDLLTPHRRQVHRQLSTSTLFSERLVPLPVHPAADVAPMEPELPLPHVASRLADAQQALFDRPRGGDDDLGNVELTA
ncbi:MAG TPA: glycosyltransferase family 1 protein [Gemmatimonadaceae bacterium]|nr:glycosyltransferase family 1 protein [Gemmatimonadaceae bacterium]